MHYPSGRTALHLNLGPSLSVHLASAIPSSPSSLDVMWVSCACPQKSIRKEMWECGRFSSGFGLGGKQRRERWAVGEWTKWERKRVVWVDGIDGKPSPFFFVDPPVCLGSLRHLLARVCDARRWGAGRRSPSFPRCAHRPSRAERSKKKRSSPSILTRSRANHFLSPFLSLLLQRPRC